MNFKIIFLLVVMVFWYFFPKTSFLLGRNSHTNFVQLKKWEFGLSLQRSLNFQEKNIKKAFQQNLAILDVTQKFNLFPICRALAKAIDPKEILGAPRSRGPPLWAGLPADSFTSYHQISWGPWISGAIQATHTSLFSHKFSKIPN